MCYGQAMEKICEHCGCMFRARRSVIRFCSRECGYAGRGKVGPKTTRIAKVCVVCGTQFEVRKYRTTAKFCSKDCWSRRGTITRNCASCGTPFTDYKSNDPRFCSKPCYSNWQMQNVRGSRHPSWKGGTSSHYRRGFDWKEAAAAARERDEFTCQRCGIHQSELPGKKRRLEVHHIVPYSVSKSNHLSNLISLCRPCHSAVEPAPAEVRKMRRKSREGFLPLFRG